MHWGLGSQVQSSQTGCLQMCGRSAHINISAERGLSRELRLMTPASSKRLLLDYSLPSLLRAQEDPVKEGTV